MKAACVQLRSGLRRDANVAAAAELIREAAGAGAELVLTPEMTNVVDRDPKRLLSHLPREEGLSEIRFFAELAEELGIDLVVGSMALKLFQGAAANRSFVFSRTGRLVATYDKLHMFDVDIGAGETWRESAVYRAGEKAVLAETASARVGLSVCYDLRFPSLYRALAAAGAQVLTVPAAFTAPTGAAHWETLLRARAIETGSFVLAAAQGGEHEDGRRTWGRSMAVDPWGVVVGVIDHDEPGVLVVDLDLDAAAETRRRIPSLTHDRPFELIVKR